MNTTKCLPCLFRPFFLFKRKIAYKNECSLKLITNREIKSFFVHAHTYNIINVKMCFFFEYTFIILERDAKKIVHNIHFLMLKHFLAKYEF